MQDLMEQLNLPTTFLPVLHAFGSVPRISEAGLDCFTYVPHSAQPGSFDLTYLYRFKDRDTDESGVPQDWKDRQIGVFHRHNSSTKEDSFVILQPHADSLFDGGIEDDVQKSSEARRLLMDDAFLLHQLLISSYFGGWREYMRDLADDFEKGAAEAFSQDIAKDYSVNFKFLQSWRNIIDSAAPIGTVLDSIKRICHGLKEAHQDCVRSKCMRPMPDFNVFLQSTLSQTHGLHQSAHTFEKRITNIADLLTNTVESRNQLVTATLSRHMERLTVDTVDDSTSVKIITYLSLVYLPGSFVATLFGMNFFEFDDKFGKIATAKNIWLYFVIFLPLTLATFSGAWVLSEKTKKKRDARERMFSEMPLNS